MTISCSPLKKREKKTRGRFLLIRKPLVYCNSDKQSHDTFCNRHNSERIKWLKIEFKKNLKILKVFLTKSEG